MSRTKESGFNGFSGLAAVEEAGSEEDDGHHQSEAGVEPILEVDAHQGVDDPGGEAQKPDPRCLSRHPRHRHHYAPQRSYDRGTGAVQRACSTLIVRLTQEKYVVTTHIQHY